MNDLDDDTITERELSQVVIVMGQSFPQLLFVLLVGLAIIVALDYFLAKAYLYPRCLRMTKQEIKKMNLSKQKVHQK